MIYGEYIVCECIQGLNCKIHVGMNYGSLPTNQYFMNRYRSSFPHGCYNNNSSESCLACLVLDYIIYRLISKHNLKTKNMFMNKF